MFSPQYPAAVSYGYQQPSPYAYGYPGYQAAYQEQQAANAMALTLYSAWTPGLVPPEASKPVNNKPPVNPFVPGLAPLPVVPSPTTFVKEDAKTAQFPCSSKCLPDDPLNWITPTIFGQMTKKVEDKSQEQRTPLRELSAQHLTQRTQQYM